MPRTVTDDQLRAWITDASHQEAVRGMMIPGGEGPVMVLVGLQDEGQAFVGICTHCFTPLPAIVLSELLDQVFQ